MEEQVIVRKDAETGDFIAAYGEYEGRGELLSDALTALACDLADGGQ